MASTSGEDRTHRLTAEQNEQMLQSIPAYEAWGKVLAAKTAPQSPKSKGQAENLGSPKITNKSHEIMRKMVNKTQSPRTPKSKQRPSTSTSKKGKDSGKKIKKQQSMEGLAKHIAEGLAMFFESEDDDIDECQGN